MAEPIRWRSKIVLVKPEASYGVDSAPTGAANAVLMKNIELRPMEGEDESRELELPWLGGQETIPTALRSVLTGDVELVGSGSTGVAPAWGPLLRACGMAETVTPDDDPGDGSVVYNPVSSAHESVTIHFWIGGTRHVFIGTRGTAEITMEAQRLPHIRFTLTGLFTTPGEQARPTPDLSAFAVPQVVSNALTPKFEIDALPMVLRAFRMSLGNQVEPRLLVGREEIVIVDRTETMTATVEAVPLSTFNPFSAARDRDRVAVEIAHGTEAGRRVTIEAASCGVGRLAGYENNQNVLEWPLPLQPLPTAGNDQFTLTLT